MEKVRARKYAMYWILGLRSECRRTTDCASESLPARRRGEGAAPPWDEVVRTADVEPMSRARCVPACDGPPETASEKMCKS